MEQVIALDVGTTGVKAALIDRSGRFLAHDYRGYGLFSEGARVEQDPEDWWRETVAAVSSVSAHANASGPSAIVLCGQMQDLIPLDADGPIGRAILYSDTRASAEAGEISRIIGEETLKARTGNLQDAASLLAKLAWLARHEPERFARTRKVVFGAHDFISWKLTGKMATDYTTVSTTGLLDIRKNRYAFDIIDALGIPRGLLPEIVGARDTDGGVREDVSAAIGVPSGTPVLHGPGDAGAATVGAGAGLPGGMSCYLGTSGWLATTTEAGLADPDAGIYTIRHPEPTRFIHVGPMLLSAGNVEWVIEAMDPGSASAPPDARFERFNREAHSAEAGSGGLVYLPYLAGERSPFRDPAARGAFIGLTRSTSRSRLYRSVLEGVAFAMRSIHEAGLAPAGEGGRWGSVGAGGDAGPGGVGFARPGEMLRMTLSGGGARSPIWPQVFADVFDCEVAVHGNAENPGLLGAFVVAGNSLGWLASLAPPAGAMGTETVYRPIQANRAVYEKAYAVFRELYPRLRRSFAALRAMEEGT